MDDTDSVWMGFYFSNIKYRIIIVHCRVVSEEEKWLASVSVFIADK